MNREQRLFLMFGVPVIAVAVVGYFVVTSVGGGGGFGGGADLDGEWTFGIALDDDGRSGKQHYVDLTVDIFEDESGALHLGDGGEATYTGDEDEVMVVDQVEGFHYEEDGRVEMRVRAWSGESFYWSEDWFIFVLTGERVSAGRIEGDADGDLWHEESWAGDGYSFAGER